MDGCTMVDTRRFVTRARRQTDAGWWAVRTTFDGTSSGIHATQKAAIDAARKELVAAGGGTLHIYGKTDQIVKSIGVAPPRQHAITVESRPSPRTPTAVRPRPEEPDPLRPDEVGAAFSAARDHIIQESHHPDTGEPDGDDALDKTLLFGPPTASRTAVIHARYLIDAALILAGIVGTIFGVPLVAPGISGGVLGVALSTLALSVGAIIAGTVFLSSDKSFAGQHGAVWALAVLVASFGVSNLIALSVGQPSTVAQGPELGTLEAMMRHSMLSPAHFMASLVAVLAALTSGAISVYGAVGAALSIACGLLIAWRVVDIVTLNRTPH